MVLSSWSILPTFFFYGNDGDKGDDDWHLAFWKMLMRTGNDGIPKRPTKAIEFFIDSQVAPLTTQGLEELDGGGDGGGDGRCGGGFGGGRAGACGRRCCYGGGARRLRQWRGDAAAETLK